MTNFHLFVAFLAIFFISMAALSSDAVAQPNLPVTHEIYSWDNDGRARAFVHVNLPERFEDVEAATIVRVECGDRTVCYHGLLSVVRTENQGAIGTFSLQLSPGVNVLNIFATASDGHGGAITHTVERFRIAVPRPRPLEVEFDGYRISAKNQDHTVNAILDFTLRRPDAWPMPAVRVSLLCSSGVSCEPEHFLIPDWSALTPDWGSDASVTEHRWRATIRNLPTVPFQLDATFDVLTGNWSGPSRATVLELLTIETDASPDAIVNWQVADIDINGYYLDGSASVDLSIKGDRVHNETPIETQVTGVCTFVSAPDDDVCYSMGTGETVTIGESGATVSIPGLRLAPGENILLVDAGNASDHVKVLVEERIVMSRDIWECFIDRTRVEELANPACSGFAEPYVRKWNLDTVKFYRQGDPSYIAVLDLTLEYFSENLGVEYEIVDETESADVLAYVGHHRDTRVDEFLWEGCSEGFRCDHADSSIGDPRTVDRGGLSLRHFGDFTPGDGSQVEDNVRFNVMDQLRRVLVLSDRPARPYLLGLANRPDFIRPHDWAMYRLIYSPKARLGSPFENLRELVVFAEETLDYEPALIEPDLLVYRVAREMSESDSISMVMTGTDIRGSSGVTGSRIIVHYADFGWHHSNRAKFTGESWSSIIFGWDEETWSSAGGRWTMSAGHVGRGRSYRSIVNFDFILADPIRMLNDYTHSADRVDVVRQGNGLLRYTVKHHPEGRAWPIPTFEVIVDPATYRMVSYTMLWRFGDDGTERLPYRVDADTLEYGAEFVIPDEIREGSAYLKNRE